MAHVAKPLDTTLEAFQNIEDAISDIRSQKNVMTNQVMISDYNKILAYLEKASDDLISAIVIFRRHEGSL